MKIPNKHQYPKRTPAHTKQTHGERTHFSPRPMNTTKQWKSNKPNRSRHSVHYTSALLHCSHGYGSSNHVVQRGHPPRTLPSPFRPPYLPAA
ncbi:hypothetical protein TNCV_1721771 [Trichonephila clavipes]|nr:hypothetical protein TNCV_1721771 [Trichonephila clavipes]